MPVTCWDWFTLRWVNPCKALSEWVISKSLQGEDNPATGYLADIQKSSAVWTT